jgi:hypothetical protein
LESGEILRAVIPRFTVTEAVPLDAPKAAVIVTAVVDAEFPVTSPEPFTLATVESELLHCTPEPRVFEDQSLYVPIAVS